MITGGVLSMLMFDKVAEAEFPARSVQVPPTDCPTPSLASRVSLGGLPADSPERLSEQAKLTVTLVWFHPFELAAGTREAVIVGGVLSMFIPNTVTEAELPATSTTVAVKL